MNAARIVDSVQDMGNMKEHVRVLELELERHGKQLEERDRYVYHAETVPSFLLPIILPIELF
jgi:hypothetical protein